ADLMECTAPPGAEASAPADILFAMVICLEQSGSRSASYRNSRGAIEGFGYENENSSLHPGSCAACRHVILCSACNRAGRAHAAEPRQEVVYERWRRVQCRASARPCGFFWHCLSARFQRRQKQGCLWWAGIYRQPGCRIFGPFLRPRGRLLDSRILAIRGRSRLLDLQILL